MSRVIKFRAWNPYQNRMMPAFTPYQMGEIFPAQCFDHLMQFTGLTDCNGVEIYEGDVCCIAKDRGFVSKVCFHKGGFTFADYMGGAVLAFATQNIEVIGNIYEHPHLLNRSSEQP